MIIGITGSFATGKSTVARFFKELGAEVIDADIIAHKAIRSGTAAHELIVSCFGKNILTKKRKIDRKKLGKIVFDNQKLLKKLSNIVHPRVIKEMKGRLNEAQSRVIVIDAPLLIETGFSALVDFLVVARVSRQTQIKRAMRKSGLSREDVLKRIKSQISLSRKIKMADFIIDNNGPKSQTKKQVKDIWRQAQTVADTAALKKRKGICDGARKGER
jgi:dephospho-CoA kinase